jgi:5-(carboxyamino)imidazole ribonucleotide synthase
MPGAAIGILGGGQLGRMMTMAAKRMGYGVHILDPVPACPAAQVADGHIVAEYHDRAAAVELARLVDVVTIEFENIPAGTLEHLEALTMVRPNSLVARIAQHRWKEKNFLSTNGFPIAIYRVVRSITELYKSIEEIGYPCVLKTASGGYDGKGQHIINRPDQVRTAWELLSTTEGVLEQYLSLAKEISVIVARNPRGEIACYPVSENTHLNSILNTAVMPAAISDELVEESQGLACKLTEMLGVVGLLAVEMFVTTDGQLLLNEIAPRPHNSGHQTFDAAMTSQFEQVIRAICGLPLGSTRISKPVAIANLMGELWNFGTPDWHRVLELPEIKLHLYGKTEARRGRKMGHLSATGDTSEEAVTKVLQARQLIERATG